MMQALHSQKSNSAMPGTMMMTIQQCWPQAQFDEVDWEHLDLAMMSKSDMYKIWRSKQHMGFCGTRVQVGKYLGLECPDEKCPNCGRREMAEHILICPNKDRT